jgi:hypothetical protein
MARNPRTHDDPLQQLRMLPVVVLTDPASAAIVIAGIRRAGGEPRITDTDDGGLDGLAAEAAAGTEVIIVEARPDHEAAILGTLQLAGARSLPVLDIETIGGAPRLGPASIRLLTREDLADVNVPVPAIDDDDLRRALWDDLRAARVEERHHLVEVDGRPALHLLEEEGTTREGGWAELAAGAAGVLAGRLAASNRRWRAQLDG